MCVLLIGCANLGGPLRHDVAQDHNRNDRLSLQQLLQSGERQRIDHVIGFELAAAGLVDPEPDIGKSASRMGIRRDRDFDAC